MYLLELEIVDRGVMVRQKFLLSSRTKVLVGRQDCDLKLTHRSVSRKHMSFRVRDERLIAADLSSTTGTLVNGQPLKQTFARRGDVFQVGPYLIRLRSFTASRRREPEMEMPFAAHGPTSTFQIPLVGPDGVMARALRWCLGRRKLRTAAAFAAVALVAAAALAMAQRSKVPERGLASVTEASVQR